MMTRFNFVLSSAVAWMLCSAFAASAHAQTAQEGKAAFAACAACHSVDGGVKPTGPTLKGIVGRKAAADSKYKAYSTALRNSKITWTTQELDAYLKAPTAKVKGTTMMVAVPDEKRRKAIIAYLRTLK
jgi:cytochrome c